MKIPQLSFNPLNSAFCIFFVFLFSGLKITIVKGYKFKGGTNEIVRNAPEVHRDITLGEIGRKNNFSKHGPTKTVSILENNTLKVIHLNNLLYI